MRLSSAISFAVALEPAAERGSTVVLPGARYASLVRWSSTRSAPSATLTETWNLYLLHVRVLSGLSRRAAKTRANSEDLAKDIPHEWQWRHRRVAGERNTGGQSGRMTMTEVQTSRGIVRRSADGWGFGLYDSENLYRYWFRTKVDQSLRAAEGPEQVQADGLPIVAPTTLVWVGLNPSWSDDGTGRRASLLNVLHWAGRDGFSEVLGLNLYAYRHTDPQRLTTGKAADQGRMIGEHNTEILTYALGRASAVLAAWGSKGAKLDRGAEVLRLAREPLVIGLCGNGEPLHPMYKRRDTSLVPRARLFE